MVPDLRLLLHQLFLLGLQPLGIGLHAVLPVLTLLGICKTKTPDTPFVIAREM